jgi:hypothetical protein
MQNFEQVKDVIQYSKTIHERLRNIYKSLNEIERPEREKMLLDYLIEKQVQIGEVLSSFEEVSQQPILDNWMQFTPNVDLHQLFDDQQPQIEIAFAEIMQLADFYSQALVEFYKEAANESELPKVKMIFENLKKMAIQANRQQNNAALFKAM